MTILFLCEGNAESWNSWSGTAKSLVDSLRLAGHTVHVGDVDLHGSLRWAAAAATVSLDRRRWATRYHLRGVPFRLRMPDGTVKSLLSRGRQALAAKLGEAEEVLDPS